MKHFIATILLLISSSLFSQENFSDRIFLGGGFGFSTGSNQTNLSLSPQVGYKITERFISGVGVMYQYVKVKNPSISFNNLGWSLFSRYTVYQQFFAYAEFERLSFEFATNLDPIATDRQGYNSLLIGGGYFENAGGRASFSLMALYNVLYDASDPIKPYNSPWVIRAGVGFGI